MSLSNTDAMKKAYTEHYALVRELVPKEQLLELELGSGDEWEKLCGFLEKDVPVGPNGEVKQYPRVNDKGSSLRFGRGCCGARVCGQRKKCSGMAHFVGWWLRRVRSATLSGRVGSLVAAAANMTCPWNYALYGNFGFFHHLSCSSYVDWQIRKEVLVDFIQ